MALGVRRLCTGKNERFIGAEQCPWVLLHFDQVPTISGVLCAGLLMISVPLLTMSDDLRLLQEN